MTTHSVCQPGPSRAERRLPGRLARLGRLPQREVERRALLGVRSSTRAPAAQRVERLARRAARSRRPSRCRGRRRRRSRRRGPMSSSVDDRLDHLGDVVRWRAASSSGRSTSSASIAVPPLRLVLRGDARPRCGPRALRAAMMLSSMSVTFDDVGRPRGRRSSSQRRTHVPGEREATVPDVRRARRRSGRRRTSRSGRHRAARRRRHDPAPSRTGAASV